MLLLSLLGHLRVLDDLFDVLLLRLALLVIAPPDWSLVLALEAEMPASAARWLVLAAPEETLDR